MTISLFSRSTPDTLPQVKVTRPYFGSSRLALQTSSFSFSNILRSFKQSMSLRTSAHTGVAISKFKGIATSLRSSQ